MGNKESTPCIVPGCDGKLLVAGLCSMHYHRHKRGKDIGVQPVFKIAPRGSGHIDDHGYNVIHADSGKHHYEHIAMAEKVLGRPLKDQEQVHHVNQVRHDNRPENLVICPDKAYHSLLHERMKARDACGNPDWRKCMICHRWDAKENMYSKSGTRSFILRKCKNERRRLNLTSKAYRESLSKSAEIGQLPEQAAGLFTMLT